MGRLAPWYTGRGAAAAISAAQWHKEAALCHVAAVLRVAGKQFKQALNGADKNGLNWGLHHLHLVHACQHALTQVQEDCIHMLRDMIYA